MHMGLAEDETQRLTFRWTSDKTFTNADPNGVPYDLTDAPVTTISKADVIIDAAANFVARPNAERDTSVGKFNPARLEITVLDVDYVSIVDADLGLADVVVYGGNIYTFSYEVTQGLFDMDVHTLYFDAQDES